MIHEIHSGMMIDDDEYDVEYDDDDNHDSDDNHEEEHFFNIFFGNDSKLIAYCLFTVAGPTNH